MNPACQSARAIFLDAAGVDDAASLAHLEACPECRRQYEDWQVFRHACPPTWPALPPEAVDQVIREAAAARRRNRLPFRSISWAAAAAAVLIAGLAFAMFRSEPHEAVVASAPSLAWEQVDLDEDLFELDADLEIALAMMPTTTTDDEPAQDHQP